MDLPLCARIDADDTRSLDALKADGWREIEVLQTWRSLNLTWKFQKRPYGRRATREDAEWVGALAAESFEHDRLHSDQSVSKETADRLKEQWARDALDGHELEMWVPKDGRFAFLIMRGNVIDLIAVRASARGKGIAARLTRSAIAGKKLALQAGTQATNIPAQRLYEKLGMKIVRRQITCHKHP